MAPAPAGEGNEKELDLLCVKSMLLHREEDDDHKYFNVVGIFEVEGVGKTRLAREICDKLEGEEETFKPKILDFLVRAPYFGGRESKIDSSQAHINKPWS
ncbi:hypothetical protein Ancab_014920 [Ancistrocladus abbreviatus]